jgi:hypothetical protein
MELSMEKLDQPYIVPEDILTHEQKVLRSRGFFFVGGHYFESQQPPPKVVA